MTRRILQGEQGRTEEEPPAASERSIGFFLVVVASVLCIFYFFYLAHFYLSIERQYVVGWGCVLILLICNRIERCKRPPLRLFFVMVAVFINIRYMTWRVTETLVYDGFSDFLGMSLLFIAELYAITLHFLGVFANIWPLHNKIIPLPENSDLFPSVDVFIATYNEDPEIVRITATAARSIDYPGEKLRVHILDDGGTIAKRNDPKTAEAAWARHYELRRISQECGAIYITREKNQHAKAGNLNHALNHTDGDLILVLDCDHVPTSDILKNTVGWFLKDRKLAFVQTPHFFINPNPIEKNINMLKDLPGEHELFYRANHPGLNFWNASFFCGSAAILRRSYLLEVGGVCGETITEDCETALALHQRGYNSVYISRPMVCGLSPETFDDFILQRQRWAQGMTQMMVLKNPMKLRGLSLFQKMCYFNNGLFWFFGISRFIFFLAPAAFLLLGLHVYFASVTQVVAFAIPHIFSSIILTDFFYGKFRWPFLSEMYEGIQSIFLIPVVLSVFANPRKPSFKVTPKGKSLSEEYFSSLTLPFFIMCLLLMLTVPAALYKWYIYPLYRDVILITICWATYNFVIAMAAFGAFFERRQVRGHHRIWASGKLLVRFPRLKTRVEASVQDVSLTGVALKFDLPLALREKEHIEIESRNSCGRRYILQGQIERLVRQENTYVCGTHFINHGYDDFVKTVQFVYSDSQRWADYWGRNPGKTHPVRLFFLIGKMAWLGLRTSVASFVRLVVIDAPQWIRTLKIFTRVAPASNDRR